MFEFRSNNMRPIVLLCRWRLGLSGELFYLLPSLAMGMLSQPSNRRPRISSADKSVNVPFLPFSWYRCIHCYSGCADVSLSLPLMTMYSFYFDLSLPNRDFVLIRLKLPFSSNCFEVTWEMYFYHTQLVVDTQELIDDLPAHAAVILGACMRFRRRRRPHFDGRWRSHARLTGRVELARSRFWTNWEFILWTVTTHARRCRLIRTPSAAGDVFYNQRETLGDGAFRRLARIRAGCCTAFPAPIRSDAMPVQLPAWKNGFDANYANGFINAEARRVSR